MPTLGIVACRILECELGYLLTLDDEPGRITVIEDAASAGLIRELEQRGLDPCRVPHVSSHRPLGEEQRETLVRVLPVGLHRSPKALTKALRRVALELGSHVDVLLLTHGLCGGALRDLHHPHELPELLGLERPVFLPWDGSHPVDDCVGLILGGRERYLKELRRVPGTFFMTPGWSRCWRTMLEAAGPGPPGLRAELPVGVEPTSRALLGRMFAGYRRVLAIPDPAASTEQLNDDAGEFAEMLSLRVETCPGTLALLQQALAAACRALVRVRPGPPEGERWA